MVIHHPYRLKVGVDNNRADVFHPAFPQIGGDLFREGRSSLSPLDDRTRRKRGKIGGKASPFPFDREVGPGVNDSRPDLGPASDDLGIGKEGGDLRFVVTRDSLRVEAVEGLFEGLSLMEDRPPA